MPERCFSSFRILSWIDRRFSRYYRGRVLGRVQGQLHESGSQSHFHYAVLCPLWSTCILPGTPSQGKASQSQTSVGHIRGMWLALAPVSHTPTQTSPTVLLQFQHLVIFLLAFVQSLWTRQQLCAPHLAWTLDISIMYQLFTTIAFFLQRFDF